MTCTSASIDKQSVILYITGQFVGKTDRARLLALTDELIRSGVHHLGIDLSGATFVDVDAIGVLVHLAALCRDGGGDLFICNSNEVDSAFYRIMIAVKLITPPWLTYDNASLQLERHHIAPEKIDLFLDVYDRHIAGLGHLLHGGGRPHLANDSLRRICKAVPTSVDRYLATHSGAHPPPHSQQFAGLLGDILIETGWETQFFVAAADSAYSLAGITRRESGTVATAIIECRRVGPQARVSADVIHDLYALTPVLGASHTVLAMTSDLAGAYHCRASRYKLSSHDFEQLTDWINEFKPHPDGRSPVRVSRLARPRQVSTASTNGA